MDYNLIVERTIAFVKEMLQGAEAGHDWFHAYRVWKLAKSIAAKENVDSLVVELAALLHDVADSKFHGGDETLGAHKARTFLESLAVSEEIIAHVEKIIANVSYHVTPTFDSRELQVVQDADRLDAMGAIGIARVFTFGGYKGRTLYDPDASPKEHQTAEDYKRGVGTTINHFYEKLLLLKDKMHTSEGKRLAEQRHQFMEHYLEEFYREWEGEI